MGVAVMTPSPGWAKAAHARLSATTKPGRNTMCSGLFHTHGVQTLQVLGDCTTRTGTRNSVSKHAVLDAIVQRPNNVRWRPVVRVGHPKRQHVVRVIHPHAARGVSAREAVPLERVGVSPVHGRVELVVQCATQPGSSPRPARDAPYAAHVTQHVRSCIRTAHRLHLMAFWGFFGSFLSFFPQSIRAQCTRQPTMSSGVGMGVSASTRFDRGYQLVLPRYQVRISGSCEFSM